MAALSKIILFNLPPSLEKALLEHVSSKCGSETESLAGMVICTEKEAPKAAGAFNPGTPLLPVNTQRPQRLGIILRQISQIEAEPALYTDDFRLGSYMVAVQEKTLSAGNGASVFLTDREMDLVIYLARHGGSPVGKDELLRDVWKYQEGVDTHTLETHIYRLRQKITATLNEGLLETDERGYFLKNDLFCRGAA